MRLTAYAIQYIYSPMKQIETFQMLADETRLRAMALMQAQGELCVCELVAALDLPQPKISRHMTALRNAGLLTSRRDAQWVFYALDPDLPDWQHQVVNGALTGVQDEPILKQDAARLKNMNNRPARCDAA